MRIKVRFLGFLSVFCMTVFMSTGAFAARCVDLMLNSNGGLINGRSSSAIHVGYMLSGTDSDEDTVNLYTLYADSNCIQRVSSAPTITPPSGKIFRGFTAGSSLIIDDRYEFLLPSGSMPQEAYALWTDVVKCSAGYFLPGGAKSCERCDAGAYCPGVEAPEMPASERGIYDCPAGYTSAAGATAETSCYITVAAGKYRINKTGTAVDACPANTYYASSRNAYYNVNGPGDSCTSCGSGKTTNGSTGNTSSSQCVAASVTCEPGYYLPANKSSCTSPCPEGYYCPGNNYNVKTTDQGKFACPTGYTSYGGEDAVSVKDCYMNVPAGYYKTSQTGSATAACGAGTYRAVHEAYYGMSDSCNACPDPVAGIPAVQTSWKIDNTASIQGGTFISWQSGAKTESECRAMYTVKNPGGTAYLEGIYYNTSTKKYDKDISTKALYFVSINPGFYGKTRYETTYCNTSTNRMYYQSVVRCESGYYCPGYAHGTIPLCSSGTYADTLGRNACPSGVSVSTWINETESRTGAWQISQCLDNSVSLASGNCAPDYPATGTGTVRAYYNESSKKYMDGCHMQQYTACYAGYQMTKNDKYTGVVETYNACTACPLGTYKAGTNTYACSDCPGGSTTTSTARTSQSYCYCKPGYGGSGATSTGCSECNAGTVKSTTANSSCSNCSAGTYAYGTGNTFCKDCPAGTYSLSAATTCTLCGVGKTTDNAASTSSSACRDCDNADGVYEWSTKFFTPATGSISGLCTLSSCSSGYYRTMGASGGRLGYVCSACGANSTTVNGNTESTCTCNANYTANGTASGATTSTSGCSPLTYTITLYSNTTSTSTAVAGYAYQRYNTGWYTTSTGNTILSKATIPTRAGYKFTGYWTERDGGTRRIDANGTLPSTTTFTSDTILYAQWELSTIECALGYYIQSGSTTCDKPCDVGYYCPGGPYDINSTSTSRIPCSNFGTGYTSDARASSAIQCYMNVAAGNHRPAETGTTLKVCPNWTYIGSHRAYWGSSDECNDCPDVTDGWSPVAGTGWESYTSCVQTRAATSISPYCIDGMLSQTATSSNSWGTSKVTTRFQAKAGAYVSGTTCSLCAAGTYTDSDGTQTECEDCSGGYYNTTAGSTSCDQCGVGYYCTGGTSRAKCPAGETTCGYGSCADEADDCGRILHAGGETIYLRSAKKTTPALHVQVGGKTYYGNMDTGTVVQKVGDSRQLLKINIGGKTYSVYNDNDTVMIQQPKN